MEVKINVDDAKFNELFEKELDALTKEDIHHIFEECVREYFVKDNYKAIDNLIYHKKTSDGYGWSSNSIETTEYVSKMIKECDMSKLQDIVDICIEKLKSDHMNLLKQIIGDIIIEGLMNKYTMQSAIQNIVRNTISQIEYENNMR